MADVTFKTANRAEQVRAIGAAAILVIADVEGVKIYVDIPGGHDPEGQLARMGGLVIGSLRDIGLLEAAMVCSTAEPTSTTYRVDGQPAGPDDVLRNPLPPGDRR